MKATQQYRDGYILILEEVVQKNEFGAKMNGTYFRVVQKLPYDEMSVRVQDEETANIKDITLDLKVRTPNSNLDLSRKYSVVINGNKDRIYTISYYDTTKTQYFFYLTITGVKQNVIIS